MRHLLLLFLLALPLQGTTLKYVRAAASGANNGTDWVNAYTQIPGSLPRDSICYVAGGTYLEVSSSVATNGSNLITYKFPTPGNHGTSVGWSDSYSTTPAVIQWVSAAQLLLFGTGFYTFDGSVSTFNQRGSYGFKFYLGSRSRNAAGDFFMLALGGSGIVSTITFKHCELDFDNGTPFGDTGMSYCLYSGTGVTHLLLEDCYAHGSPGGGYTIRDESLSPSYAGSLLSTDVTFRRCIWENFGGGGATAGHHWEETWLSNIDGLNIEDCLFHNVFKGSDGNEPSGWNMIGFCRNVKLASSIFWQTTGATQGGQGPGMGEGLLFTFDSHQLANTNVFIVNNTFAGLENFGIATIGLNADTIGGENLNFYNNIVQGSTQLRFTTENLKTPWTVAYNWRSAAMFPCFRCIADSAGGQTDFATSDFASYSAGNFKLLVNSLAGNTLVGGIYAPLDFDGVPRGVGSAWSRGAYQFVTASQPPIVITGRSQLRGAVNLRVGP